MSVLNTNTVYNKLAVQSFIKIKIKTIDRHLQQITQPALAEHCTYHLRGFPTLSFKPKTCHVKHAYTEDNVDQMI